MAYVGIETEDRNLETNMEFFAFFIFVACDDLRDVRQRWLDNCQSFSIVRIHLWVQSYFLYRFHSLRWYVYRKSKSFQNKLSKEKSHVQQEKIVFAEPHLYSQRLRHITSGICRQLKGKYNLTTLRQRCIMFDFFRFKFTYLSGKGQLSHLYRI